METIKKKEALKGGEFLIRDAAPEDVFIPEEFSEEQQMMAQACRDFVYKEIMPQVERIEKQEEGLAPSLIERAGELGLLAITMPEEYGGLGMDFNTSMLMADIIGATGAFSTTYGAQSGIGTLPIQYYGNDAQKEKYLPGLATGDTKASYALTEPDAGSDANSGKTRAVLNEAGTHYLISGQKMWISNAGFADLFIVFAKIDDDKNLSAFIVEKEFGNIELGEEEEKMGIKGSSTRQVFFNETPVPVENLLGERGGGFKIAVNILNIGRIKLGAGVIGGCKDVITQATQYANNRKQFGQPIANFGAIKQKLAEMAIRTFTTEAACYRAGQNIDDKIEDLVAGGMDKQEAILKGAEQFAIECAIMKVHGSEALDFVVDEGVQIYGGMGFSADAPMERAYRDARITRIYEGTNEINRMLLVGMLLKRAMKGELDIMGAAKAVQQELTSLPQQEETNGALLATEKTVLSNLKKAILMVAGKAAMDLGPKLNDEQEVLMSLADMLIEVYAAESVLLRAEKLAGMRGEKEADAALKMARVYLYETVDKVWLAGKESIASFAKTEEQTMLLAGLKRFTKGPLVNTRTLRREIADILCDQNKYAF